LFFGGVLMVKGKRLRTLELMVDNKLADMPIGEVFSAADLVRQMPEDLHDRYRTSKDTLTKMIDDYLMIVCADEQTSASIGAINIDNYRKKNPYFSKQLAMKQAV